MGIDAWLDQEAPDVWQADSAADDSAEMTAERVNA